MYSTRTRVHARIPNGHPREEKRARRTKVRGLCRRAERAARAAAGRLPREDPCAEVGEEVGVGPVEFKL